MAQLAHSVVGHKDTIQKLIWGLTHGRLPHAMLFTGPAGVGKKRVALALAQILLCQNSQSGMACGNCGPCLRVGRSQSEGLLVISPEKNGIKLDQARQVLDFLSLRSITRNRVVVIDKSEELNTQAANSLLKMIEEPPEDTYFILIAPSPKLVLKTISSRCQNIPFAALSEKELAQIRPAPQWVLRAAQGSAERVEVLLDRDEQGSRTLAENFLRSLWREPFGYMENKLREGWRDRGTLSSMAKHAMGFVRDGFYFKMGKSEGLLNPDRIDLVEEISQKELSELEILMNRLLELERDIDANLDTQLLMEKLWIECQNTTHGIY